MSTVCFQKELDAVIHEYHSTENAIERIGVVMNNLNLLRRANLLEEIFLDAWSYGKHSTSPQYAFLLLFAMNPNKLLALSDPLPPGDVFTIYRGVAGVGEEDRTIRGYSWSGSLDIALEFATMRGMFGRLPDPAVYRSTIDRKDVLAYIDHPVYINQSYINEEEFIVRPGGLSEPVEILCPTKESIRVVRGHEHHSPESGFIKLTAGEEPAVREYLGARLRAVSELETESQRTVRQ